MADNLDMCELFDDVAIAGQHDADVGSGHKRPRKGSRNGGESTDADEVVHLRSHKENLQATPSSSSAPNYMQERVHLFLRPAE